jgi:hypothetical protein
MRRAYTIVCGVMAAAGLAHVQAEELPVNKFKYPQPAAKILVCPAAIAPADCDPQNALDVIVGPPSAGEIGRGVQSQELLAGTGIRMRDGQYVKVACAGKTAQAG